MNIKLSLNYCKNFLFPKRNNKFFNSLNLNFKYLYQVFNENINFSIFSIYSDYSEVTLNSFAQPFIFLLLIIHTNSLNRVLSVSHIQYIMCMSNSPSFLFSLGFKNFNIIFLVVTGNFFVVPIFLQSSSLRTFSVHGIYSIHQ